MVVAVKRVVTGLVDHHGVVGLAYFVAQRGRDLQFTTDLQAETQLIEHRTGGPGVFGDAGHCSKAQAGHFADHLKYGGHRADSTDGGDVCCRCMTHVRCSRCKTPKSVEEF
ncbi:hypothetical protein D3C86_1376890 [compost metagenome]